MITQQMPRRHCSRVVPLEPATLDTSRSRLLQGRQDDAEAAWEFACNSISVGCRRYGDLDWLSRIRRCARSLPCHLNGCRTGARATLLSRRASMTATICRCRWPPRMVRHMSDFLQHKVCAS